MTYRVEGKWTPSAPQGQPNATEAFDITGYEPFLPDRQPGGRISAISTSRCLKDPWLNNTSCQRLGTYLPDDIRAMWTQLQELYGFPWTGNVLSARDKSRFLAEYNRVNNISTAPAIVTKRLDSQRITPAPTILQPTAQQPPVAFVERRPITIRIAPPANWNVTSYLVQLQRRDGRGNWILHTNLPVGAASAHGAGYNEFGAGPQAFSSVVGSWRLAAQVSSPTQSAWSNWVEFSVTPSPASLPPPSRLKDRIRQ